MMCGVGVRAMERHHHGRDVNAACGQLALNTTETMLMITAGDIEDLVCTSLLLYRLSWDVVFKGKGSLNQRAPKKAQKRDGKVRSARAASSLRMTRACNRRAIERRR